MKKPSFLGLVSLSSTSLRRALFALLLGGYFASASSGLALPHPKNSAPAQESAQGQAKATTELADPRSRDLNEKGVGALNAGRFEQAEDFFRQSLAADPHNLTAAFNLGGMLLNNKKIAESISLLEGYTAEYTKDPGLYARLGDSYFADKKVKKAAEAYQKAFELDHNYPKLPKRLATVYGLLNRPTDAEKFMQLSTEEDPKDFKALASYSSLLLANGKADEAINAAKRSLQIKPSSEAYVTLGSAYEIRGDLKNSLISFQRASDLGDSRKELAQKIAMLEKLSKEKS